jgi:cytochrome P450 family 6
MSGAKESSVVRVLSIWQQRKEKSSKMDLIIIVALIGAIIYLANKYFFSFWTRLKVKQIEPSFVVGNAGKLFTLKSSMGDFFENIYNSYKNERFVGAYLSYSPVLIVNDPELIQNIMISDFSTFHDRPTPGDAAENYPLVGNLFNLRGQKWRDLRIKFSPTFTSGKLKMMFPTMRDCGKVLQEYVAKEIKSGQTTFDFKDLSARFTINNISSVAFGVDNDCINEPDNIFRKMGLKLFEPSLRNGIVNTLAFFAPRFFTWSKIAPFPADLEEFIYSLVNETVEFREKNNVQRNDFMQMMIQLKNQGYVSAMSRTQNGSKKRASPK